MARSSAALALIAALFLAGCQQAEEAGSGTFPESRTVPLLQPHEPYAPERDDPPALVAELVRRQRQGLALLREAHRARADAPGGCVRARSTVPGRPQPVEWSPQPPKVEARVLGRLVEVDVELRGNPTSLACRPILFVIVVSSSTSDLGDIEKFQLFGPGARTAPRRFRVLGHLPINGTPPYRLETNVETAVGRPSVYVNQTLKCPTGGCLSGPTLQAHAITLGSPVLPLRGVTPSALERSLQSVFAFGNGDKTVGPATCRATACSFAFTDRFRGVHGRARYRIHGEQVPGCWLGTQIGLTYKPVTEETHLPQTIGGCVGWE